MSENQVRTEKKGTGIEIEKQVRVENYPLSLQNGNDDLKNQVRVRKTDIRQNDGKGKGKLKTRCYYTDYVNHAIRFYLTTPETLKMDGKKKADVDNWIAVQAVFHCLKDEDRQVLEKVYRMNYRIAAGVKCYCQETGMDERRLWMLITKTSAAVARRRGLI